MACDDSYTSHRKEGKASRAVARFYSSCPSTSFDLLRKRLCLAGSVGALMETGSNRRVGISCCRVLGEKLFLFPCTRHWWCNGHLACCTTVRLRCLPPWRKPPDGTLGMQRSIRSFLSRRTCSRRNETRPKRAVRPHPMHRCNRGGWCNVQQGPALRTFHGRRPAGSRCSTSAADSPLLHQDCRARNQAAADIRCCLRRQVRRSFRRRTARKPTAACSTRPVLRRPFRMRSWPACRRADPTWTTAGSTASSRRRKTRAWRVHLLERCAVRQLHTTPRTSGTSANQTTRARVDERMHPFALASPPPSVSIHSASPASRPATVQSALRRKLQMRALRRLFLATRSFVLRRRRNKRCCIDSTKRTNVRSKSLVELQSLKSCCR